MGYYFAILSFPSVITAIIFPIIFAKVPRKLQFILSFTLSTIALVLMGPSLFFGLPNEMNIIIIGLVLMGMSINLTMIPNLPEAMDFINYKYKIIEGYNPEIDNKLSDVFSSLFSLINYLFALIAPIIGAFLYDNVPANSETEQYRKTMDINMWFMMGCAIFYLLFNCGNVFSDFKKQNDELEKMSQISEKVL